MIDFYFWPTPNGQKVAIMLEEVGLEYTTIPVNILEGEQFAKDFLTISPNNKIPAIVDHADGTGGPQFSLFESGAILIYLADKTGQLLPSSPRLRIEVLQWLMFQMASVGPMFGQCGHFLGYAPEKIPYAIDRYQNETLRLYKVMDKRLADVPYIAGDYSIADVAIYPWVHVRWLHEIDITQFPNVERWYNTLSDRPAVQRGCALLNEHEVIGDPSDETREAFFGRTQLEQGQ
ncbi:MAG: glutathione S-transferase N-terminal domain-containing protein [Gammaproteobacteria bacterium]|nr:glutathione S-transferase N-terminal domain-containing protein [Gammaproteobacteria bacterium]MDE0413509.1 glutathione S-transferase N-terminal domain-containing protein [Gammaproteobacteria bacterium]